MTRAGRPYTPKQTENAEAWVRLCCVDQVGTPRVAGPVRVRVEIVVGVPSSASKRDRAAIDRGERQPTGKPDVDNVLKLILDALNGIAWCDDSQIVDVQAVKRFGNAPCVVVEFRSAPSGAPGALL